MVTLKVKSAEKEFRDDRYSLKVSVEFLDGDKVVASKVLSFPIETSEKDLKVELKKHLDLYNQEAELAEERAGQNAAITKADKTVESLTNLVIK